MTLGTTLRRLRVAKQLTIAELAKRIDTDVGNLSRIERDKTKPSLTLLYRLAAALDYSLSEIFQLADGEVRADERHLAFNAIFINLLDRDKDLLLEFAKIMQANSPDLSPQPGASPPDKHERSEERRQRQEQEA